jgi:branched-subunit amino acid transport protein
MSDRCGPKVTDAWFVVLAVGTTTVAIKSLGPVLLGGRSLPSAVAGVVELLAPAMLAALVVTQALASGQSISFDAAWWAWSPRGSPCGVGHPSWW